MNRLLAPEGHIDDVIQLIDEKHCVHAYRNRGHLTPRHRSNKMRLLFTTRRANDCLIMAGPQRLGELTLDHQMVTRLADLMDINEEILIIDRDFDAITLL